MRYGRGAAGNADLVLAKGRCAWETLLCGAAVIPLDAPGMASLVTSENYQRYSQCNFGRRILLMPITADRLNAAIDQFCPIDAIEISQKARGDAALSDRTNDFVALYREIISEEKEFPSHPDEESVASGRLFGWWAKHRDQHVKERVKEKRIHRVAKRFLSEGIRTFAKTRKAG